MKRLIIDIETIANKDMIKFLPEPEADSRLKDPIKIEASIKEKKQKQTGGMGLNPTTGKIFCVGIKGDKETSIICEETEKETLEKLAEIINNEGYEQLVTFNGYNFDIPFINFRFIAHNIDCFIHQKRYENSTHYDVMQNIKNWNSQFSDCSQYLVACALGIKATNDFTGKDVQKAYDNGEFDKITDHCKEDIEVLEQIYGRL